MKRVLIFVWREEHVKFIQARANPADLIVSLNLDASALLRTRNIAYQEMTDFISPDDLRALQEEGYQLSQTWFQPFEADCMFDGVSPLRIEATALASFMIDGLIARRLFCTIANQHELGQVVLFDHPKDHIIITENGINVDLWTAVWRVLAAEQQINVEIISISIAADAAAPKMTRVQKIKKSVGSIFSLVKNWTVWQRLFIQTSLRREKTAMFAPMISEGYRYAQLYDEVSRTLTKGRLLPAALGARRIGGIQFKGYSWSYRALSLIPMLRYFQIRSMAKRWYEHFLTFQQTYKSAYPELFANPFLSAQFQLLFLQFLPNSFQVYDDARTIFRRMNTRVVITSTFPILHAASVHAAAQSQQIEVLSLPHSGGPTDKNLRLKGDRTLIWTKDFARVWHSTQGDTPMVLTGLHPSITAQGYEQTQTWQPGRRARKRITLLLATNQSGMRQWADMRQHYETLKVLAQVPTHLQDKVEVIFKLHPVHDYRHVYKSIVPDDADHVKIIRNIPLEPVLRESHLAVMVNISTSAHLLALAEGIPLLYISTVHNTIIHDYLAIAEWGEEMTIRHNEQIWEQIERVLFDSSAQSQLLAANQRYWKRLEADEHDPVAVIRDTITPYLQ